MNDKQKPKIEDESLLNGGGDIIHSDNKSQEAENKVINKSWLQVLMFLFGFSKHNNIVELPNDQKKLTDPISLHSGKPKLVVFTGAGMTAESGISTFRDVGGLWDQYDVMEVCSAHAMQNNRQLVFQFFNDARRKYASVQPNAGHRELAALEDVFDVTIITQNIDDLHEQAGSSNVIHLHGNARYKRNERTGELSPWSDDLAVDGNYRPHVVLFGEIPENLEEAMAHCNAADVGLIIGTSLQVYPAAGLRGEFKCKHRYLIDPTAKTGRAPGWIAIPMVASEGCHRIANDLRSALLPKL